MNIRRLLILLCAVLTLSATLSCVSVNATVQLPEIPIKHDSDSSASSGTTNSGTDSSTASGTTNSGTDSSTASGTTDSGTDSSTASGTTDSGTDSSTVTVPAPDPDDHKDAGTDTNYQFSDVTDPTHAYFKAIYWAAGKGITKGYEDGTFGINKSCTRGAAVMFLWRLKGQLDPKYVSKSPFSDVSKSHSYYRAILWASQRGITKGYKNGTFGINTACTRGHIMMFLWRAMGCPKPTAVSASPFKDVPKTHAYYNAILWGSQNGITKGYISGPNKGKFGINDTCTRGQIVTFLYRTVH